MIPHRRPLLYTLLTVSLMISGCDNLTGAADTAKMMADSKATGSACRNAGRGVEDCFTLNPQGSRAAIFAGWKEMNDYMRENKIEEIKPVVPLTAAPPAPVEEVAKDSKK